MPIQNPTQGLSDQFSGGINKMQNIFKPKSLPVPASRSFLFEVINTKTNMVMESFTLVVPPVAITIREPQRVNVTKTFGNIFVDDYGPDNVQIMIKGFSGTSHAFPTFKAQGTAESAATMTQLVDASASSDSPLRDWSYNHRAAFYEFRDSIMRYKYRYKDNYGDMKLRVYDLYDQQSYDCVLMDFSCDRTAERPLYYPYAITLLVYGMPDQPSMGQPEPPIQTGGILQQIIDGINAAIDFIDACFLTVGGVMGAINAIANLVANIVTSLATIVTDAEQLIASPLNMTKSLITRVGDLAYQVENAYTLGQMTLTDYLTAKETIDDMWRQSVRMYMEAIGRGSSKSQVETLVYDMGILPGTNSVGTPTTSRASKPRNYSYSGYKAYTVKGQDTLQAIALAELGNSDLWPFIAKINKITNNVELQQKETIYIPASLSSNKDAYIVTESTSRNPYGTDIRLDTSGDFMISGNDFVLVSGQSNVIQWVNMMLKTKRGSILKHTALGLSAIVGEAGSDAALGYMVPALKATLQVDPRIQSIDNINMQVNADVIQLNMRLALVGYDKAIPVSVAI